jgi:pilus assembly protein Flp/PilA
MKKCIDFMVRLGRDEEGTALIEYTMLLGLIAVAVITAAIAIGLWVGGRWSALCTAISGSGIGAIDCAAGTGS